MSMAFCVPVCECAVRGWKPGASVIDDRAEAEFVKKDQR